MYGPPPFRKQKVNAAIGTALAWAGSALELDSELVRRMGAVLLGLFALVILSSRL